MNKIFLSLLALVSFGSAAELVSDQMSVEAPVLKVFAPSLGYDDNDLVQVVVDGVMPNACYQQGRSEVKVDPSRWFSPSC